jgi:hypothetical protein
MGICGVRGTGGEPLRDRTHSSLNRQVIAGGHSAICEADLAAPETVQINRQPCSAAAMDAEGPGPGRTRPGLPPSEPWSASEVQRLCSVKWLRLVCTRSLRSTWRKSRLGFKLRH